MNAAVGSLVYEFSLKQRREVSLGFLLGKKPPKASTRAIRWHVLAAIHLALYLRAAETDA